MGVSPYNAKSPGIQCDTVNIPLSVLTATQLKRYNAYTAQRKKSAMKQVQERKAEEGLVPKQEQDVPKQDVSQDNTYSDHVNTKGRPRITYKLLIVDNIYD